MISAGLLLTACGGGKDDSRAHARRRQERLRQVRHRQHRHQRQGLRARPGDRDRRHREVRGHQQGSAKVTEAELPRRRQDPGREGEPHARACPATSPSTWTPANTRSTAPAPKTEKTDVHRDRQPRRRPGTTTPPLVAATQQYATWVTGEVKELVTGTEAFTAAVKAGDIDRPRRSTAGPRPLRAHRAGRRDLGRPRRPHRRPDRRRRHRRRVHRLPPHRAGAVGEELHRRHRRARRPARAPTSTSSSTKVQTVELPARCRSPTAPPTWSTRSSTSKITGEEERYSHTDLLDFDGNVAGAHEAVDRAAPGRSRRRTRPRRDGQPAVRGHRHRPRGLRGHARLRDSGYVDYTQASTDAQRRALRRRSTRWPSRCRKIAARSPSRDRRWTTRPPATAPTDHPRGRPRRAPAAVSRRRLLGGGRGAAPARTRRRRPAVPTRDSGRAAPPRRRRPPHGRLPRRPPGRDRHPVPGPAAFATFDVGAERDPRRPRRAAHGLDRRGRGDDAGAPGARHEGDPNAPPEDTGEAVGLTAGRLTVTIGSARAVRRPLRPGRPPPQRAQAAAGAARREPRPAVTGGDLCVQACADDPQVAFHAVRNLARLGIGTVVPRWIGTRLRPDVVHLAASRPPRAT